MPWGVNDRPGPTRGGGACLLAGDRLRPQRRVQSICEDLRSLLEGGRGAQRAGQYAWACSPPCCPVLCHPRAAAPHQSMIRLASPSLLSVPRPRIPRRAASFTTMVRAANPALSGMRAPRRALQPNPRPMQQRRPAWWWQRCLSGGRCRPPTSAGWGGPIAGQNPSRWTSASCARRRSTALGAAGARPAPRPPQQRTLPPGPRSRGGAGRPAAPHGRRAGRRPQLAAAPGTRRPPARPPTATEPTASLAPTPVCRRPPSTLRSTTCRRWWRMPSTPPSRRSRPSRSPTWCAARPADALLTLGTAVLVVLLGSQLLLVSRHGGRTHSVELRSFVYSRLGPGSTRSARADNRPHVPAALWRLQWASPISASQHLADVLPAAPLGMVVAG